MANSVVDGLSGNACCLLEGLCLQDSGGRPWTYLVSCFRDLKIPQRHCQAFAFTTLVQYAHYLGDFNHLAPGILQSNSLYGRIRQPGWSSKGMKTAPEAVSLQHRYQGTGGGICPFCLPPPSQAELIIFSHIVNYIALHPYVNVSLFN